MAYDPRTVANEFIIRGVDDEKPLTHIEVQKLLYFCHGWMLGIHGRPFLNGMWEAWRYGPVLPDVYFNLNHYRGRPITAPIPDAPREAFADEEKIIMDVVYGYRSLGTFKLVGITHSQGGPWDRVWHGRGDSGIIGNEMIREYFASLLQQDEVHNG